MAVSFTFLQSFLEEVMTKKERTIIWRWPLVAFIVIGIIYTINYVCGGSFLDPMRTDSALYILGWRIKFF